VGFWSDQEIMPIRAEIRLSRAKTPQNAEFLCDRGHTQER
jgi:hypothetical protein